MFSFFNRTPRPKLIVTEDDKLWIEANIEWMMQQYGVRPLLLPPLTMQSGPFAQFHDRLEKKLDYFMGKVCDRMDVDPDDVALHLYSAGEDAGLDGPAIVRFEDGYSLGEYHHRNNLTGKFDIHINRKVIQSPQSLFATMAHEVGHIKLLGEYRVTEDNDNHEYYTDLTAIYFGFGIFMANTCNQRETWSDNKGYSGWAIGRQGYLPQQMIVYALAVQAYLQGRKDPEWADQLAKIPRKMFKQSLLWLHETGDCDVRLPQAHGGRASDI
jgi:hypothetical protein